MSVRKYTSNRRKCRFFMSVIVHNSPNMIRCEIIQILILNVNKRHRKMCWDYISSSFVKCQHPWTLIPSHEHCRNNKCCICPLLIKYRTWLTKYEDFQEWGRQMCWNEYLMSAWKSIIYNFYFSVWCDMSLDNWIHWEIPWWSLTTIWGKRHTRNKTPLSGVIV